MTVLYKGVIMIVSISGYESKINERDFEKFSKIKWRINRKAEREGKLYFQGWQVIDGKKCTVQLHRYLMDCIPHDGKVVDHIDRNTLNNDTDNLRFCTIGENCRNSKKRRDNTSGYKGVDFNKAEGKYRARIRIGNGKRISLGLFSTPELAYEAYCKAVPIYHKEFGRIE